MELTIKIDDKRKYQTLRLFLKSLGISIISSKGKEKTSSVKSAWQPLFNSLQKFTPDFLNKRKQPVLQKRESID